MKNKEKINIPFKYIPKEYIGEKFGLLLVFVKGEHEQEISEKVDKITKFCESLQIA